MRKKLVALSILTACAVFAWEFLPVAINHDGVLTWTAGPEVTNTAYQVWVTDNPGAVFTGGNFTNIAPGQLPHEWTLFTNVLRTNSIQVPTNLGAAYFRVTRTPIQR
jgi:hypothetical protein